MLNYLRYLYYSMLYPELRDYVDKGLGIQARYHRCRRYWEPHLKKTREFLNSSVGESCASIGIAGSGRLLDVDPDYLQRASSGVTFFDADPAATAFVRRVAAQRSGRDAAETLEFTGVMEEWTGSLRGVMRGRLAPDSAAQFMDSLTPRTDVLGGRAFDITVSLNMLSQIPLFWRDRAESILLQVESLTDGEGNLLPDVHDALVRSCRRLQEAHVSIIREASKSCAVVISDVLFHYYTEESTRTEPALHVDIEGMMEDAGWRLDDVDSWIWHIVPKGVESSDYGVLHEVRAWNWKR